VDHTARIYAIDTQGNWRLTFPFGMETGDIIQDVVQMLRES
jgi:cytochrome oxidase Cu insertion factor (SCO1/SenC/PrrC family)